MHLDPRTDAETRSNTPFPKILRDKPLVEHFHWRWRDIHVDAPAEWLEELTDAFAIEHEVKQEIAGGRKAVQDSAQALGFKNTVPMDEWNEALFDQMDWEER